jgi:NAD(P)-dependent dehydrogenase (short-subunit alcohol dehydrogenase family)
LMPAVPPTPGQPGVRPGSLGSGSEEGAAASAEARTLRDCRALVTGSSRGIGRAVALALAQAGAAVVLHGRTASSDLNESQRLITAAGHEAAGTVVGDLAREIVGKAAAAMGAVNVLVNNAGVVLPVASLELDEDTWDQTLAVNLRSAFFAAQAAAHHMRANGGGRIVNISSAAAEAAIDKYLAYGVAKAGLNAMTRYLAAEWAADDITVNAVAPAFIRTTMAEEVFAKLPDLYEDQLRRVPRGRMGEPAEVAAAVVFLAGQSAGYITGEIIHVDGGYLIQ